MKTNKGRLQDGQKICSNCNKDYFENQNFSWKCRIHKSDYSDEMQVWWCCGKKGRDSPGCKFGKHECKDDEDSDDIEEKKKQMQR